MFPKWLLSPKRIWLRWIPCLLFVIQWIQWPLLAEPAMFTMFSPCSRYYYSMWWLLRLNSHRFSNICVRVSVCPFVHIIYWILCARIYSTIHMNCVYNMFSCSSARSVPFYFFFFCFFWFWNSFVSRFDWVMNFQLVFAIINNDDVLAF